MTFWLDNQLPPALAPWMRSPRWVECAAVRDLDLHRASDLEIFTAARAAQAVVITKDADFVDLVDQHEPSPQVVLVTCGNTSNVRLRRLAEAAWPTVRSMLERGEPLIEPGDRARRGANYG